MSEQMTSLPPPTQPSPPAFRLLRSRQKVLGGVCDGLARATAVDVTLVRLAFVATALVGLGILAYLVLWVVVPKEDPAAGRVLRPAPPDTARWIKNGLAVAAALSLLLALGRGWGPLDEGPGFLLGLLLIAAGAGYLWSRRRDLPPVSHPLEADAPPTTWAAPHPATEARAAAVTQPVGLPTATQPVPVVPGRARNGGLLAARIVGWVVLFGAILGAAAFGFVVGIGALEVHLPGLVYGVAGAALVTLLVANIAARSAGVIVGAIALLVASGLLTAGLTRWDGAVGERITRVADAGQLQDTYTMAVGRRVLDLSQVDLAEGTTSIRIEHRIGQVEVVVPDDVAVVAAVDVALGDAQVLGREESGVDTELRVADGDGASRLQLDIEVGAGQAVVCRAADADPSRGGGCLVR